MRMAMRVERKLGRGRARARRVADVHRGRCQIADRQGRRKAGRRRRRDVNVGILIIHQVVGERRYCFKPSQRQLRKVTEAHSHPPGKFFPTTSHNLPTSPTSRSARLRWPASCSHSLRFSSLSALSCATTSPGSSTRCFIPPGSGSSAFRLISSSRSGRPRRNLGWENSHVWASVDVRCARGVYVA